MSYLSSESLDRTLPFFARIKGSVHLSFCRACNRYQAQLSFLRRALQRIAPEYDQLDIPGQAALSDESKARIKRFLAERSY